MNETPNENLVDVRTVARNLAGGRLTPEQAQAFLDALEDSEADGAWTTTQMAMPSHAVFVEPVPEDE